MSLTSQISTPDSPFALFAGQHLPNQRGVMDGYRKAARAASPPRQPPAPPGTTPAWGTIGAAIDHRLRYAFTCRNVLDGAVRAGIEHTAKLALRAQRPDGARAILDAGNDLEAELADLLEREQPDDRNKALMLSTAAEDRLDRLCVVMVWFEEVFRSGFLAGASPLARLGPAQTQPPHQAPVPDNKLPDRNVQVRLAHDALAALRAGTDRDNCHSGPAFAGSSAVGGADADLIAGSLLVTSKLSRTPSGSPAAPCTSWPATPCWISRTATAWTGWGSTLPAAAN